MRGNRNVAEIGIVGSVFVILIALLREIVVAADLLWRRGSLLNWIVEVFAAPVGGNLDIPVVIFFGFLAGWLLLFLLDGTKRIQAIFLIIAITLSAGLFFLQTGRIIDAVLRVPGFFILGFMISVVSGISLTRLYGVKRPSDLSYWQRLQWLQFPAASGGLYYSIIAVILMVSITYTVEDYPVIDKLILIAATIISVFCFTVFVKYDYERRIVAVSLSEDNEKFQYHPYVFGGLFGHAEDKHHGFIVDGHNLLHSAKTATSLENLRDIEKTSDTTGSSNGKFHGTFAFATTMARFLPSFLSRTADRWFMRTAIVDSQGWTTDDISSRRASEAASQSQSRIVRGYRWTKQYLWLMMPMFVRDYIRSVRLSGGDVIDRLDSADTVLLISPTPETGDNPRDGIEVFRSLAKRYKNTVGTTVVIATVEAQARADQEGFDPQFGGFRSMIANELADDDNRELADCTVIPVDRFGDDGPVGFSELLDEISR